MMFEGGVRQGWYISSPRNASFNPELVHLGGAPDIGCALFFSPLLFPTAPFLFCQLEHRGS
jgi:hypothetical protein